MLLLFDAVNVVEAWCQQVSVIEDSTVVTEKILRISLTEYKKYVPSILCVLRSLLLLLLCIVIVTHLHFQVSGRSHLSFMIFVGKKEKFRYGQDIVPTYNNSSPVKNRNRFRPSRFLFVAVVVVRGGCCHFWNENAYSMRVMAVVFGLAALLSNLLSITVLVSRSVVRTTVLSLPIRNLE